MLTSETWSGDTTGTVSWALNSIGQVISQSINARSTVSIGDDDDDLVTSVGVETLSRSATNGKVESITLGDDSFGVVEGSAYIYDGTDSLFTYALERDEFGRIIEQTETVEGGTAETVVDIGPGICTLTMCRSGIDSE